MKKFKNCNVEIEGSELVIRIDLSRNIGPSNSGKTLMIGTTSGTRKIGEFQEGGRIVLGVNCYTDPEDA